MHTHLCPAPFECTNGRPCYFTLRATFGGWHCGRRSAGKARQTHGEILCKLWGRPYSSRCGNSHQGRAVQTATLASHCAGTQWWPVSELARQTLLHALHQVKGARCKQERLPDIMVAAPDDPVVSAQVDKVLAAVAAHAQNQHVALLQVQVLPHLCMQARLILKDAP